MYRLILLVLSAHLIVSCSHTGQPNSIDIGQDKNPSGESIYWVNSLRAKCVGVGPMHCLQVQKNEQVIPGNWKLFYSSIDGFQYEAGYIYKLLLKEENVPADKVPADGSSIKYTLIEQLDKDLDPILQLNDIWALETIQQQLINPSSAQQRPQLEIHLNDMNVIGTDGCNDFTGAIKQVDTRALVMGPIAATSKYCHEMTIADQFNQHLNKVRTYILKDLKLYLRDAQGEELFRFQKID